MKVQDLFKQEDGTYLMNTPRRLTIAHVPSAAKDGKFGAKYPFRLTYNGETYFWDLNEDQKNRLMTKYNYDPATKQKTTVRWTAKVGDELDVQFKRNTKEGGRDYYDAEPTPETLSRAPSLTPADVESAFSNEPVTHYAPATGRNLTGSDFGKIKSYCGFLNALLSSGNVDFNTPGGVEKARAIALTEAQHAETLLGTI